MVVKGDVLYRRYGQQLSLGHRLFCQRGLASWLVEWGPALPMQMPRVRAPATTTSTPMLPADTRDELTPIVATMVEQLVFSGVV